MPTRKEFTVAILVAMAGQAGMAHDYAFFKNNSSQACSLIAKELVSVLVIRVSEPGEAPGPGEEFHGHDRIVVPAWVKVSLRDSSATAAYKFRFSVRHQGEEEPDYDLVCSPGSSSKKWKLKRRSGISPRVSPIFPDDETVAYQAPSVEEVAEPKMAAVPPAVLPPAALPPAAESKAARLPSAARAPEITPPGFLH